VSLQPVGAPSLARQLFGGSDVRVLALLRAAWPRAVGRELARRTEVVALEGRTLRIRVPDAGWRKVLHRMRGDILDRLRGVAGSLAPQKLGFMEAPLGFSAAGEPKARSPQVRDAALAPIREGAAEVPLPPALLAGAAGIPDPETRDLFLETARRYLVHRRDD
jgi:hypothetical protein